MSMRLNKYIAQATGLSRRAADQAIASGKVYVNGQLPAAGHTVAVGEKVTYDGREISSPIQSATILFHKPAGYVVSRDGQGNQTVYDLLPASLQHLKPVGRLDKDSSGLLLLTTDGDLAQRLTHPKYQKTKVYEITINKPLQPLHRQMISDHGISLEDGVSRLELERLEEGDDTRWQVRMHEGRNRQIRRTFAALGYDIRRLHRTQFGNYMITGLKPGAYRLLSSDKA